MNFSLDSKDLDILIHLQPDSTLSNVELAKKLGMAPSAVLERVKKLEQKGIIEGYPTRINPNALNLKLLAFIFVKSSEGPGDETLAKHLAQIPEVLEMHHIAGDDCYLLKIRADDPQIRYNAANAAMTMAFEGFFALITFSILLFFDDR